LYHELHNTKFDTEGLRCGTQKHLILEEYDEVYRQNLILKDYDEINA
jgi:hypothetical protein